MLAEPSHFGSFAAEGGWKMKWRREVDYHGSRSYGGQEPPVNMLSLMAAWVVGIVRGKLRRAHARSVSPVVLLHDGQHSFSLLGAKSRSGGADCPFPIKAEVPDRRDWRVLP
jgi:hypothetical protein